jgi:hypothetical protein
VRCLVAISLVVTVLAARTGAVASPSPSVSSAVRTAEPAGSATVSASPCLTLAPSSTPTFLAPRPTPKPTPTPTPMPTPTLKPVAGWPSISRAGITMTGVDEQLTNGAVMDGRLRLSITVGGLRPGQAVSLQATAKYALN